MTVIVGEEYTDIEIEQGADLVCFPDDMTGCIRPGSLDNVANGAVIIWGKSMTSPIDPLVLPKSKGCHLVLGSTHKYPITSEIMDRIAFVYIHRSNEETVPKSHGYYLWVDSRQPYSPHSLCCTSPLPLPLLSHYGGSRRYEYIRKGESFWHFSNTIPGLLIMWSCYIAYIAYLGYLINCTPVIPIEEQVCVIEQPVCDLNEEPLDDFAGVDEEMQRDCLEYSPDVAELRASLANLKNLYENHLKTAHEMAQKQAALLLHLMQSQRDLKQLMNNLNEIEV